MSAGAYYFAIDMNKDRYFAKDVAEGDALNLIDNPQQVDLSDVTGGETTLTYNRQLYVTGYHYTYFVQAGTNVFGGFDLGNTSASENGIRTEIGVLHRARIEVAGYEDYSGKSIVLQVWNYDAGTLAGQASIALTASWQSVTAAFTPTDDRVYLRIIKNNDAANYSWTTRKVMVVEGAMPTAYNTGAGSDYHEDISTYVMNASWSDGMSHYDETVSGGGRATILLDNREGYFYQEGDGAELVVNGDMTAWTGNIPDNWTKTTSGGASAILECGFDSLFPDVFIVTGVGTDSCNFYSNENIILRLAQTILTVGKRYKCTFDIGNISSGNFRFFSDVYPISNYYSGIGHFEFYFTAPTTDFSISNGIALINATIDNVSVVEVPRYAGLAKETLVTIRADYVGSEYPLWLGRMVDMKPVGGELGVRMVTMECEDAMQEINRLEYTPTGVIAGDTVRNSLVTMFGQLPITWPYASQYWVLGSSILGVDTWLFNGNELGLSGGNGATIDYPAASASNMEHGISASAFLRDLMTPEIGGRFYQGGLGQFEFVAHDSDPSKTVSATITSDQFDSFEMLYGADVLNTVSISYKQKRLGSGNVVLWTSNQDIVVSGKSSKTVTGRYFDPTNAAIQVSALSKEAVVRGVDYIISPDPNNLKVTVAADAGSSSVTFTIDNDREIDITVTTLQIRGFPLFALTEESILAQDAMSAYGNNIQRKDYSIPILSDSDTALAIATGLCYMRGKRITRLQSITFTASEQNIGRYFSAITNVSNTRLTLAAPVLNHEADYVVVGTRHSLVAGGDNLHTVTWILAPMAFKTYWILEQVGFSELGINTIPIY